MTAATATGLAVLVAGAGSLALRLLPLMLAARLSDRAARAAGYAGLSVIAGMTVRAVMRHEDAALHQPRLVAALAVGAGLVFAARGRSVLLAVGAGALAYVALSLSLANWL